MKKYLTLLFLTLISVFFFSCSNNNSKTNADHSSEISSDSIISHEIPANKLDSIVNLITSISAGDFYKNQKPSPVNFKNVKLKYIKKQSGEELYILCGQFVTTDNQEIQFATIKNKDYEQWVGTSAQTYCQNSKEILYSKEDLSSVLKNKFIALKK
jgi:hypothetical protein